MIQINPVVLTVIAFTVLYHIIEVRDVYKIFMLLTLICILGYMWWLKYQEDKSLADLDEVFIDKLEKDINQELVNEHLYFIHRSPSKFKYIRKKTEVVNFILAMKFLDIYYQDAYHKLITYLEAFFKIHFNILIGKYDGCSFLPILSDIRIEILNIMSTLVFNLPQISTIVDIKDIDIYVDKQTRNIDAILQKHIKIAYHKYNLSCTHLRYNGPKEYNKNMNPHVLYV